MKKSLILFLFLIFIFPVKLNSGNFFITSYNFNDSDAPTIASKYDFVVTSTGKASAVTTMKASNPAMKAVCYKHSLSHGSTYYVLDAKTRKKIVHKDWGWYLMDPSVSAYRTAVANDVLATLNFYTQFDGVFLDDCATSLDNADYYQEGTTDPPTFPSDLDTNFRTYMTQLIQTVKTTVESKLVIVNCSPSRTEYLAEADGMMDEYYGHANWQTAGEYFGYWTAHVNALINAAANGKYYLAQSGVRDGGTQEQIDKLVRYSFSSFLMGVAFNNSLTKHYFCPSIYYKDYYWYLDWDIKLGNPVEDYYQVPGTNLYRRNFEKGIVLVNPTTQTGKVILEKAYCNLNGQTISEIDFSDHEGIILVNFSQETMPPAPPKGLKIIGRNRLKWLFLATIFSFGKGCLNL